MAAVCNVVKCSIKFAEHRIISYVSRDFFDVVCKLPYIHYTASSQQMWLQKGWSN